MYSSAMFLNTTDKKEKTQAYDPCPKKQKTVSLHQKNSNFAK